MAIDKQSLKKLFPNLARELENGDVKINIDSVHAETDSPQRTVPDKLRDYNPTVVDFIRRCDTETQAESIIAYMERRGEITNEYAEHLRQKLTREGIRSFGPKKEDGYYFTEERPC